MVAVLTLKRRLEIARQGTESQKTSRIDTTVISCQKTVFFETINSMEFGFCLFDEISYISYYKSLTISVEIVNFKV
jgi:hypothetical protein